MDKPTEAIFLLLAERMSGPFTRRFPSYSICYFAGQCFMHLVDYSTVP